MSTSADQQQAGDPTSPDAGTFEDLEAAGAGGGAGDAGDDLTETEERDLAEARAEAVKAAEGEGDAEVAEMQLEDALGGGLARLLQFIERTPPYRADGSEFHISLRLYPELVKSPLIKGVLGRPSTPMEESRETLLAVTVTDKGRTKDGAQRQGVNLNDTPANARMFHAICQRVHCALQKGQPPRDWQLEEMVEGIDRQTGDRVRKPVRSWLPGYVKDDFIYALLDSRCRLVDAEGNLLDDDSEEAYYGLIDLRQFYVLQEIGSVQKKDGTWTPPRHRCLYVINEPTDAQRDRFKESGFYMEQQVKDRRRSEQRSVKLRILMALFDKMADNVYGMVVSDGTADGVRPLNVQNPVDRKWIFGTWQKSVLLPVFNNLMGVGSK